MSRVSKILEDYLNHGFYERGGHQFELNGNAENQTNCEIQKGITVCKQGEACYTMDPMKGEFPNSSPQWRWSPINLRCLKSIAMGLDTP